MFMPPYDVDISGIRSDREPDNLKITEGRNELARQAGPIQIFFEPDTNPEIKGEKQMAVKRRNSSNSNLSIVFIQFDNS